MALPFRLFKTELPRDPPSIPFLGTSLTDFFNGAGILPVASKNAHLSA